MTFRRLAVGAFAGLLFAMSGCSSASPTADSGVTDTPGASSHPSVTTSPVPKPVSLVAAGDIACDPTSPYFTGVPGNCEQEQVGRLVGKLVNRGASWFVPLGDEQYETGSYQAFKQVYDKSFGQFKSITEPVAGNHEWTTPNASGYFRYFGKRAGTAKVPWRTFDPMPGWQVLLLDSNCEYVGGCGPQSPEGRWITRTLAASSAPCVIAAWHHPLHSSGEYAGDADAISRAQPLWNLVDAGGADIVLNGHDHIYERFKKIDGMQQFTVGTGGKSHYDITTHAPGSQRVIGGVYGVLQLTMHADSSYRFEFVSAGGHVMDRGKETCTNKPRR